MCVDFAAKEIINVFKYMCEMTSMQQNGILPTLARTRQFTKWQDETFAPPSTGAGRV